MRFANPASAPVKERFTPTVIDFSSARASRRLDAATMAVAIADQTAIRRPIGCVIMIASCLLLMIAPCFLRHCVHDHIERFAKRTPSGPVRDMFIRTCTLDQGYTRAFDAFCRIRCCQSVSTLSGSTLAHIVSLLSLEG